MSSNNRRSRDPQPEPFGDVYEDDVVFEGSYQFDEDWAEEEPRQQPPSQRAEASPRARNSGTASQIDQLRRNIGQRPTAPQDTARQPAVRADEPWNDDADDFLAYEQEPAPQPRRTDTRPVRQSRAAAPPVEMYEEESFAPYDEYEDDFSEYDAPRAPARSPRPRPQITMPSISRPTLPPAIANADLVNDVPSLGMIGAGVVSLAAMAVLVSNQASSLAPEFATHVSASGILENFASESALWRLPLMAIAFTLMNIVIAWFVAGIDRFASRFVLAGALVLQFVVWVAIIRIL